MPNFFLNNTDLLFHFNNADLREIVNLAEDNYTQAREFPHAPVDYDDARENYRKVLEMVGDLAGNHIAQRAAAVDEEGATFADGHVEYAKGTQKNVQSLSQADLMGMVLPREYGGLRFAGHR